MSERTLFARHYAIAAAALALVAAPLLALSYFAIGDGKKELDTPTVSAWADPARRLAGGLVTFASADRVYATYIQLFALLLPAILLSALSARSLRPQRISRPERWGWRLALTGYLLLALGIAGAALLLIGASPSGTAVNIPFVSLVLPGVLLSTIGSTTLGIALLRARFARSSTAWLLAFAFPLWFVGSFVLGHNSIGLLPLFVAWALTRIDPRRQVLAADADLARVGTQQ
jgi:hypothetical protein